MLWLGIVNNVPTPGISIVWLEKLRETILLVEVMDPENVPLIDVDTGVALPIGSGPVSVVCRVKVVVWVVKSMLVLFFTPEKAKVPRAGLPLVVMLVELCGV